MIPWLDNTLAFPPVETAMREPNGLLCAGGDLSPQRILEAYRRGIFPWHVRDEPILWWSPSPRMALFPCEFKISRSLRKTLRGGDYRIVLDGHFPAVIRACADIPRAGQAGTWITPEMQAAYGALFELGFAHSVETWRGDRSFGAREIDREDFIRRLSVLTAAAPSCGHWPSDGASRPWR